jgi:predicted nucleic acid-binding protein
MIVLDTNVVSAAMAASPDPRIIAWLDGHPPESLWITAISVFEIRYGIDTLVSGKRRRMLEQAFARAIVDDFQDRVLALDESAATAAAAIAAARRRVGRPVDLRDTLIAGIASSRRATIATRNSRHFRDLDVPVIDPWT